MNNALTQDLVAALEDAADFLRSEYYSAQAEALEGHPISAVARPVWEKICDALAKAHTEGRPMTKHPELRPCPFCGATGDDVVLSLSMGVLSDGNTFDNGAEVRCNYCGGSVDHEDKDYAVNLWNGKGFDLPDDEA